MCRKGWHVVTSLVVPSIVALALMGLVWPAHAQNRAPLPPVEDMVAQFSSVAFGHEHGISRDIIQKWTAPPSIAYFIRPQFDVEPHVRRIRGLLEEIYSLTGMAPPPADSGTSVTLRFGFYPRSDFRKLPLSERSEETRRFFSQSACIAVAVNNPNRPGDITTGAIVVGTDISERLRRHCIAEELVQVLGLPNDACLYRPSLFCEQDVVDHMTPADRILLATLYDERIAVGMTRVDAMPVVRQVISELYADSEG